MDYRYEADKIQRIVGGVAVAKIHGGVGFHSEELELCLVQYPESLTSRYCHIQIQVERPIYRQFCRVGDNSFTGPLPTAKVSVSYGSATHIKHSAHGELLSGSYNKVCLLDQGAPLSTWLPRKDDHAH